MKILKKEIIWNFYFNLPSRSSPRGCSRGTPGGLRLTFSYETCRYQRKCHWKCYDDWFMNGGDI